MPRRIIPAEQELFRLESKSTQTFVDRLLQWGIAINNQDVGAIQKARSDMVDLVRFTQQLADLLGRRRVLLELDVSMEQFGPQRLLRHAGAKHRVHYIDPDPLPEPQKAGVPTPLQPSKSFREAVIDITAREPRLAGTADLVAEVYSRRHGFTLVNAMQPQVVEAVQNIIREALEALVPIPIAVARIQDAALAQQLTPFARGYAETVYRTNLATAYTAGRFQQAADPEISQALPAFRYSVIKDSVLRRGRKEDEYAPGLAENHLALDGMIAATGSNIWQIYAPPNGYNSVAPWVRVSGNFETVSKAQYSGPLVEIETRNNTRLSVTINHPILTQRGFVAAGDLCESDYLVIHNSTIKSLIPCSRDRILTSPPIRRRAIHNQDIPPRIEDVFDSALRHATGSTFSTKASGTPLDFHGDARFMYGDVHIIGTDGLLPDSPKSISTQHPDDRLLMVRKRAPMFFDHRTGALGVAEVCRLGPASNLDVFADQAVYDAGARGSELLRQLQNRYAAEIDFSKIISIKIRPWSGHVYDLQSPNGIIVAQGVVISNCRCNLRLVSIFELQRRGVIRSLDDPIPEPRDLDSSWVHPRFSRGRPDQALYFGIKAS